MLDFPVLLLLYSMTSVVPDYENDPHEATATRGRHRPSPGGRSRQTDCVFAFLVCSVLILTSYLLLVETPFLVASAVAPIRQLLLPVLGDDGPILLPIFTRTLLYSIITLNAARHPDREHNINFFPVPGRYAPIFHVAFGVLMGYRNNEVVHGIVVGLAYHLLVMEDGPLAPLMGGGKRAICAPDWLVRLVDGEGGALGGVAEGGNDGANGGIPLEPGANLLHRAAAVGDVDYVRGRIERSVADGASMPATRPFRQGDRNGWQPLHEAARSGHLEVLAMLLEVDRDDDGPVDGGDRGDRRRRREPRFLHVDVNARTGGGETALRLVEEHHGADDECAVLLREVGGVSLGCGDDDDGSDDDDE